MRKTKQKSNLSLWLGIIGVAIFAVSISAGAYSGLSPKVVVEGDYIESAQTDSSGKLGGVSFEDERFLNDVVLDQDLTVGGDLSVAGTISGGLKSLSTVSTRVASTTLTSADSGKTFILTTTTEFVLPATSTSAGVHYKFVVGGSLTASSTIRTSDLGNNIEGTLIVAGAVVDCAAEDLITIGASVENIGDYVELWSNGTYWFIGDSGALTSTALACTADGS